MAPDPLIRHAHRLLRSGPTRPGWSTAAGRALRAFAVLPAFLASSLGAAEKVVGFRNGGTGAYPDADPPLEWSVTKNVKWRWDAPPFGTTISSPIIVGDRIITLARPMTVVCVDKNSGKELWRTERYMDKPVSADDKASQMHEALVRDHRVYELASLLGERGGDRLGKKIRDLPRQTREMPEADKAYFEERIRALEALLADGQAHQAKYEAELAALRAGIPDDGNAMKLGGGHWTAATPASDGERIFAMFLPGLLACCDLSGKPQWTHAMVNDRGRLARQQWGAFAEVPMCADGKVLAMWGNLLHCLEAASGKLLWAREMAGNHCAASPVLGHAGGVWYFMHSSGEVARLDDGKTLFTAAWGGSHRYWATSRSADGRTFHYVRGAVRLPDRPDAAPVQLWSQPEGRQKNTENKETNGWIIEGGHSFCAPVIHDGIVYFYETCGGHSSALDAQTGALIYGPVVRRGKDALVVNGHKPDASYADLNLAGDHLIMFSKEGDSVVLKAGRELRLVRRNPTLGKVVSNNPVFEGKRMYVRTQWSLFCFENPQ